MHANLPSVQIVNRDEYPLLVASMLLYRYDPIKSLATEGVSHSDILKFYFGKTFIQYFLRMNQEDCQEINDLCPPLIAHFNSLPSDKLCKQFEPNSGTTFSKRLA